MGGLWSFCNTGIISQSQCVGGTSCTVTSDSGLVCSCGECSLGVKLLLAFALIALAFYVLAGDGKTHGVA